MNRSLCCQIPGVGIKLASGVTGKATEQESFTNPVLDDSCLNFLFSDVCRWYNGLPIIYNIPVNDKALPCTKILRMTLVFFMFLCPIRLLPLLQTHMQCCHSMN